MKKLRQQYTQWRERNRRKHFEWWSRKREQGHPRWVLTVMFLFAGSYIFVQSLNNYFQGDFDAWELPFTTIGYLIGGLILGATSWWSNERKYQNFLKARETIRR